LFHAGGRIDRGTGMTQLFVISRNSPKHTGFTAINMDSKLLCKAKYASGNEGCQTSVLPLGSS
jgi:hypothetical protein